VPEKEDQRHHRVHTQAKKDEEKELVIGVGELTIKTDISFLKS